MTAGQLSPTGVSVLLVYGAKLHPPVRLDDGTVRPGIRATVNADGSVLIQAVGYRPTQGANAIGRAAETCRDAGLDVYMHPPVGGDHARLVKRKVRPS